MKNLLIVLVAILFLPTLSDAGWLSDKLKKSGESIADQLIDDGTDATYKKTKEETEEVFDEDQKDQPVMEEDEEPPWAGSKSSKKKKRHSNASVRTDLHFSAKTLMTDPETSSLPMRGEMYVDGTRMRWNMSTPEGNISMIVAGVNPEDKVYTIIHDQEMYMESTIGNVDDDLWSVLSSPENPCEGYRKSKEVGQKILIGRSTIEWKCTEPEEEDYADIITIWIDRKLNIAIRYQESDGNRYEITELKVASPPGKVFNIPSGYRAISYGGFGN